MFSNLSFSLWSIWFTNTFQEIWHPATLVTDIWMSLTQLHYPPPPSRSLSLSLLCVGTHVCMVKRSVLSILFFWGVLCLCCSSQGDNQYFLAQSNYFPYHLFWITISPLVSHFTHKCNKRAVYIPNPRWHRTTRAVTCVQHQCKSQFYTIHCTDAK